MVDQICIYGVLEVPSSVVGEEYVDRFATGIWFIFGRGNGIVHGSNDVGVWSKKGISFHFF